MNFKPFVAVVLLSGFASSAFANHPVPPSRKIDWTYTGVPGGIPNRTNICATFSPGATAAEINNAISFCNDGVVFLNAGTYTAASLGGSINVNHDRVTLRGAGANKTSITGAGMVSLGGSFPHAPPVILGTAITGGAAKGSKTFTVASTANLSPGTMIEIDRDDDPNLVVNTGNQGGGTRNVTQVNLVTAVNGDTITLRNPFIYDFSSGNPKIKFYFTGIIRNSSVEDLKLEHDGYTPSRYNFLVQFCDSCWLKGIESAHATGYHFVMGATLNMEVRDSYIHEQTTGPNNGGLVFYGNYRYGGNSSAKVENNIFNQNFPDIELNNTSSGFYIGYNFSHGSNGGAVTWTLDNDHTPFNIMNLYEGNIAEMWGGDGYFGGSGYATALRNYFTGYNPNFNATGDPIQIKRLNYYYNIVGNVIGSPAQNPSGYEGCGDFSTTVFIYQLGYPNIGNCDLVPWDGFTPPGGYPDQKVASTLLRWGNYDYFNKSVRYECSEIPSDVKCPSHHGIPRSYYYKRTPSWWPESIPWPPIGPDVTEGNEDGDTSGHVNKIPAQVCWETSNLNGSGSFNADSCYFRREKERDEGPGDHTDSE